MIDGPSELEFGNLLSGLRPLTFFVFIFFLVFGLCFLGLNYGALIRLHLKSATGGWADQLDGKAGLNVY